MATERPCELLERQNPGTHGQTCPIVQEPSSPRGNACGAPVRRRTVAQLHAQLTMKSR
jgi:hypothetical protein